jgi:pimeloyl-ACP methyl ester carboxylesterase
MLSVVSACLLGLVGLLLRWSPGKPKPFVDKNGRPLVGSISEKTFVDINGTKQGMFIKGKDATNPVLLYLHGGMPDYFLTRRYPTGLEAAPVTARGGTPEGYLDLRDKGMHSLGVGTTHDMDSVIAGLFLPSLRFPEYTLTEKINLWRAKFSSGVSILWDKAIATDLSQELLELDLPVYFFHGVHDHTVNYALAKEYFEELEAPLKGFYTFEHSAHSPMFEEPEKARRVLRGDVLAGTNGLADAG